MWTSKNVMGAAESGTGVAALFIGCARDYSGK
jgi:hypothetical protein